MHRIVDAAVAADDLDAVLDEAVEVLADAVGLDRAAVLLRDDEGVMRFRAWRGLPDSYRAAAEGHSAVEPRRRRLPRRHRRRGARRAGLRRGAARRDRRRGHPHARVRSPRPSPRAARRSHALPRRAAGVHGRGAAARADDRRGDRRRRPADARRAAAARVEPAAGRRLQSRGRRDHRAGRLRQVRLRERRRGPPRRRFLGRGDAGDAAARDPGAVHARRRARRGVSARRSAGRGWRFAVSIPARG